MPSMLLYILNVIIPGYALHRSCSFCALAVWSAWLVICALFIQLRLLFGIEVLSLLVASIAFVTLSHHASNNKTKISTTDRRWVKPVLHVIVAIALYTAIALDAKNWFGFELHYIPSVSMSPAIKAHDVLLSDTSSQAISQLRLYDVVVFDDPQNPDRLLVKRLAGLSDSGLYVLGDNARKSHDSRYFGDIEPASVKAIAKWVIGRWENDKFILDIHAIARPDVAK